MSERQDNAGIRFPPPFVFLGLALLGPVIDRLLGWSKLDLGLAARIGLALVIFLAGALLAASAIRRFRRYNTPAEPWAPSERLVTDGIYRSTRNPMYLALTCMMAGIGMALGSKASLLLVPVAWAIIALFVVPKEEAYLERRFGEDYRAFKKRSPRWF